MSCRHFSIVAPENIRPNSDYHVSVSLHDSPTPCDFRVGIEGVDNYRNTREIHVEPYTSQLVQIDTGYMAPGNYKLIAEGLRGVVGFRDDAYLTFLPKNTSILLQSDKAIYKPGDLVRFRVLVLDMNMKPQLSTGPIRIFITVRAHLWVSQFVKTNLIAFDIFRTDRRIVLSNGWMPGQAEVCTAMNWNCHRIQFSAIGT